MSEATYDVQVTLSTPDGTGTEDVHIPIILPHELLVALRHSPCWDRVVAPGAFPQPFWERVAKHEMQDHFVVRDSSLWDTLPFSFHGDSARFTKNDSLLCLSISSLLGGPSRDSMQTRHLLAAVPTKLLLHGSIQQFTLPLAWSFASLADGKFPSRDHLGNPFPPGSRHAMLAGQPLGLRAVVTDWKGDWQFQSAFWGLPQWNSKDGCCWSCQATPQDWHNFAPDVAWRSQLPQTTTAFLQGCASPNPLCYLPDWSLSCVRWDEMHTLKLGLCRWTIPPSILTLLEEGLVPGASGATLEGGLRFAWRSFKQWCRENGLDSNCRRFSSKKLGLSTVEYAESATPAWATRLIIGWLASVFAGAPPEGQPERFLVLKRHLWSLNELFRTMEECKSLHFTPQQTTRFCDAADIVLATYLWLADDSVCHQRLHFPVRPKLHGFVHLAMSVKQTQRCPKFWSCMMDEDYLGRVCRLAKGVPRRTAVAGVIHRYRLLISQTRLSLRPSRRVLRRKSLNKRVGHLRPLPTRP